MKFLKPCWENQKFYPSQLDYIVSSLIAFADKDYQIRVWVKAEGPEVDWFDECTLTFDDQIAYLKSCWRNVGLTSEQIKAILKVHVMVNHFEYHVKDGVTRGWEEEHLYIVNHPYFEKIRKQAKYALSLIRIPDPALDVAL